MPQTDDLTEPEPAETFSLNEMLNQFSEPTSENDDDSTENSDSENSAADYDVFSPEPDFESAYISDFELSSQDEKRSQNDKNEPDMGSKTNDSNEQSSVESQTNAEIESPEMVKLPECFFNDVITESKPNRLLKSFLDFEQTKKQLVNEITPVPTLENILSKGMARVEKRPRRNLDDDLEAILNTKSDDFMALPKKLSFDSLKLDSMLNSEMPILESKEKQIEHKKSLEAVKNEKIIMLPDIPLPALSALPALLALLAQPALLAQLALLALLALPAQPALLA